MNRILGFVVLLALSACAWTQRYEITRVEGPRGAVSWGTYVSDINDLGQVVGVWRKFGGYDRAFIWENGVATDLGGFGGNGTHAVAINNAGTVVGNSRDVHGVRLAFVWTKEGGMKRLFPSRSSTWATGINEAGDVVGSGYGGAFLVSDGVTTVLPLRFPNGQSYTADINDIGEIVGGDFQYQGETPYPTLWIKGVNFGLPGGGFAWPMRINNNGQIAGYTGFWGSLGEPVTWINRQIIYLPMLAYGGQALDIDENGLIVGYLHDESYRSRAVVWRNLQISNLNNRALKAAGWHLISAHAINERGQIIGRGSFKGSYPSYLLTPVSR
ncbi:MAG: DUF3466 family protein [Armatimonadota bacterium]|nr:DUF3466 family protein [Armatimonadota bacterium]